MSRFLFVNQHYGPDTASTGQHLSDLVHHLARAGHEVRVLCSDVADDDAPPRAVDRIGVDVRRVGATTFGRRRTLGRLADYVSFHARVAPRLLLGRWADVVVTLTTPPLLGAWGSLASRLGGPPHVAFVMDHHPDAEFELGLLSRRSLAGRLLEGLYGFGLRGARLCVALGPHQDRRTANRSVPQERRAVVPIWADEVHPSPWKEITLREELGWSGRFVVLYSGNIGLVHRFEELVDAMTRLDAGAPEVLFAFVGNGPRRGEVEEAVRARGLSNARFHEPVPRASVPTLFGAADAHFVSLRPEHVGVSVPSKLYAQLASGRPVLFVGPDACETAEDLRAAGAGGTFGIGEGRALAGEIRQLAADRRRRHALGESGREWFARHRERDACCERWRHLLERVAAEGAHEPVEPVAGSVAP